MSDNNENNAAEGQDAGENDPLVDNNENAAEPSNRSNKP